ncbi:Uncharacterised protein [uncultured archaeon]|nr:Uncharacterised protein [uncultured archaeon]
MLSAVVVLPTPPFRFTTATTLIDSYITQLHIFFLTLILRSLSYQTMFYLSLIYLTLIYHTQIYNDAQI